MIRKINLLHYLPEDTYRKICVRLGLDFNKQRGNIIVFPDEKIKKIDLYNIDYMKFGHIWFMDVEVDFPKLFCEYDLFGKNLYEEYYRIFEEEIMAGFPTYDQLCCTYIEYVSMLALDEDSSDTVNRLQEKCVPEQLDKALWDKYKKPHGTIEFCVFIEGNSLETLARCYGTTLKKRVRDTTLHKTVGLIPEAAVNKVTEMRIMDWLYKQYGIS